MKLRIKKLQCRCFGHKPFVKMYAMRAGGKQQEELFHVMRETTCMRCGKLLSTAMEGPISRAQMLHDGWFLE